MRILKGIACFLGLTLVVVAPGCSGGDGEGGEESSSAPPGSIEAETDELLRQSKDVASAVSKSLEEKRQQFMKDWSTKVDELSQRAADLKVKLQEEASQEKKELAATLDEKQQALANQLERLGSASGDAWQEISSGVQKAYAELETAVKKASSSSTASDTSSSSS